MQFVQFYFSFSLSNFVLCPVFLNEYGGKLRFQPQGNPEFKLLYDIEGLVEKNEDLLVEKTMELLDKMKMLYEPVIYN